MKKAKTFDSGYFRGKSHFADTDGTENYLVLQPIHRYFKVIANTKYISEWKSKGLSDESIKPCATSDNSLSPLIDYVGDKIRLKHNGGCLKQAKLGYIYGKTINIYINYELTASSSSDDEPTARNSLLGIVRLTKSTDIDKYGYSGWIGFDRRGSFSFPGGGFGLNVIFFGVDMSSSLHVDNKKGHFNSSKRTNTRIRTYTSHRKNVFN